MIKCMGILKSKVICIGEALVDEIIDKSKDEYIHYLGGAPANVACTLSNLSVDTAFIGCVGNDDYGQLFIKKFEKIKIDHNLLQISKKFPTRIVQVEKNQEGDRVFVGFQNNSSKNYADEMLDVAELTKKQHTLETMYISTKYIVVGTLFLSSSNTSESIYYLLNYAQKFNIKIIIDVNWRDIFWDNSILMRDKTREEQNKIIKHFLGFANLLKLSKEEAIQFFRTDDPIQISCSLQKKPDVIITDGPEPIAWYVSGFVGLTKIVNTLPIVDTTGAGDAFLGGLISKLIYLDEVTNENQISQIIQYASACGLLNCLSQGAIDNLPNDKNIQAYLETKGL